jgi:hypothetical protein
MHCVTLTPQVKTPFSVSLPKMKAYALTDVVILDDSKLRVTQKWDVEKQKKRKKSKI